MIDCYVVVLNGTAVMGTPSIEGARNCKAMLLKNNPNESVIIRYKGREVE